MTHSRDLEYISQVMADWSNGETSMVDTEATDRASRGIVIDVPESASMLTQAIVAGIKNQSNIKIINWNKEETTMDRKKLSLMTVAAMAAASFGIDVTSGSSFMDNRSQRIHSNPPQTEADKQAKLEAARLKRERKAAKKRS